MLAPVVGDICGSDGIVVGTVGGFIVGKGGITPLPLGVGIDGNVVAKPVGLVVGLFAGVGAAADEELFAGAVDDGEVDSSFLHPTSTEEPITTTAPNRHFKFTLRFDMHSP